MIEGSDGSGKGTQSKLLVNRLRKSGKSVKLIDFPQYETTFFGGLVGRFLKGDFGGITEVDPHLASLTYAGDRWQAKDKINRWLDRGYFVVANRYALSNMTHQGAKLSARKRRKFWDYLEELEYRVYKIPKEDLNIYLRVDPLVAQKLVDQKDERGYVGGRKRDIQEDDINHLREASRMYDLLANRYPGRVSVIECCTRNDMIDSIEEIHEKVWQTWTKHFS